MKHPFIYHIFEHTTLEELRSKENYSPQGFEQEGFIHASTKEQVARTLNKWFKGKESVKVMKLDASKIAPEVLYEDLMNEGILFPHIYGELNTSAIIEVIDLKVGENGKFEF